MPNHWVLWDEAGVATDVNDHVWALQRPGTLDERKIGASQSPRAAECCAPAPSVIEFDPDGNVLQAWGNPDTTQPNVWITGYLSLVFFRLWQIGEEGKKQKRN